MITNKFDQKTLFFVFVFKKEDVKKKKKNMNVFHRQFCNTLEKIL